MKRIRIPSIHIKTDRVQTRVLFTIFRSSLGTICYGILIAYWPRRELAEQELKLHLRGLKTLRGCLLDLFAPDLLIFGVIEDLRRATNRFYSNMCGLLCEDERGTWVRCDINDDIVRSEVRWSSMPSAAEIFYRSPPVQLIVVLAIFPIIWNILTVCGHFTQKLGILQLEIATAIYGIVLLLKYAIWWQKSDHPDPWELSWNSVAGDRHTALKRRNQSRRSSQTQPIQKLWMLSLASTIFISAYDMPWNHAFPTKIERTLWEASVLLPTMVAAFTAVYLRTAYRPECFQRSGRQVERMIGMACLGFLWRLSLVHTV